jgi:hypothetical protein
MWRGFFVLVLSTLVRQGVLDTVEGVIDLLAQDRHNGNHDDGDESENDRIFHETLAFFFECKQHGSNSFLNNKV